MVKLEVSHLFVRDVMTNPVVTFNSLTTIKEAIHSLIRNKISGAPLIDPKTGNVETIVSEADLMKLAAMSGIHEVLGLCLDRLPAKKNLVTVGPDDPYSEVFKKFLTHPVRRVLVLGYDGALLGIVSRRDIIRSMLEEEEKLAKKLEKKK